MYPTMYPFSQMRSCKASTHCLAACLALRNVYWQGLCACRPGRKRTVKLMLMLMQEAVTKPRTCHIPAHRGSCMQQETGLSQGRPCRDDCCKALPSKPYQTSIRGLLAPKPDMIG